MNVWLILWVVLAVSLLAFMAWTFSILMRQKRGWSKYAEKRKLRYKSNALMDAPEVSGVLGEHTISLFASEHMSEDARGSRKLTALEVNLNSTMPIKGGVATNGMIPVLKSLQLKSESMPVHKKWKKSYVAASENRNALDLYLTDERIEAMCDLMEIKNCWFILVFKGDAMLLRLDIADPLVEPKELDKLVKKVLAAVEVLELKRGEQKVLKSEALKYVAKDIELEVDETVLAAPSALTLEGDDLSEDVTLEIDADDTSEDQDKEKAEADKAPASSNKSKKK